MCRCRNSGHHGSRCRGTKIPVVNHALLGGVSDAINISHRAFQQFRRQTFAGSRPQQFQLLTAADQIAAPVCQFVASRCIGFIQLLQPIADLIQILNKEHELVIQPTRTLSDFSSILALTFLLPETVDHPQGREQGGWTDNHNVAIEGFLKQIRLSLQGS